MKKYALGYALSLRDLMRNFPPDKINLNSKECQEQFKDRHKWFIAGKIWKECVKMVVNDIIENNATFELPINKKACLHMQGVTEDNFVKGVQKGKWKDVDFLASDFTGYVMQYDYQRGYTIISKNVYVNKKLKDKITKRTNEGKPYY